ncbi:MAG: cupin domain-containing protein [Burkholderiaceae bacterium]
MQAVMELNADFSRRVVMHAEALPWMDSPLPGVRRRMLDRIGGEVARATTIVSYAPDSRFSSNVHGGGEEFVVLEGVFEDEHGGYPVGSYVRNPPQSRHTPGSTSGCMMFVKLWQFDPADRTHVRLNFDGMESIADPARAGVTVTPLFSDEHENVRIETWAPGIRTSVDATAGAEILVLAGGFVEGADHLHEYSWIRVPIGERAQVLSGRDGARVWIKTGHLRFARHVGA